ncbi:leucine-rich repeat extensin-like protein 6 [Senna tora]|uniref:Cell wall hydroxyproline-rich glycoprotein n=1 Tax=Senna tora TaxID=362788 RepID=A0A834SLW5_9FABA|nr:leucine-rich repeat extensin-like protein 6 [Senna tora]
MRVRINRADGIDHLSLLYDVNKTKPYYYVNYWINPKEQHRTRLIQSLYSQTWDEEITILLRNDPFRYRFLYLEVMRICARSEPGTSNGITLVSKGRVPLPDELDRKDLRRVAMMSLREDVFEPRGALQVALQVIRRHGPNDFDDDDDDDDDNKDDVLTILQNAYTALQSWKRAITSDPNGLTVNWNAGAVEGVCNYTGVYCAPPPDDPHTVAVAGIDLTAGDLAGTLPDSLGLLADLAVLHIGSNRFAGTLPSSLRSLGLLFELDVGNNNLSGPFPDVVLHLPSLAYLDLRFNSFSGEVPPALFDLPHLDALFLNDNAFRFQLPENLGNSAVSALVLGNIDLERCRIPPSVAKMKDTLDEIVIVNSRLGGCLGREIGDLVNVRVFDVSNNELVGPLPEEIGGMVNVEVLNVAENRISGEIPASVCSLKKLRNFAHGNNCFTGATPSCLINGGRGNFIPATAMVKVEESDEDKCKKQPIDCNALKCS